MPIIRRPWGDTDASNAVTVVASEGATPFDITGEPAGNWEYGRVNWEGAQRSISTVPDAFVVGDWIVAASGSTGEINVTISSLPADNNSAITDIQYRIDAGTWTSIGGTTATLYTISGLTDDVQVTVELRAVNSVGNGLDSDDKTVTPTAAGYVPEIELGANLLNSFDIIPATAAALNSSSGDANMTAGPGNSGAPTYNTNYMAFRAATGQAAELSLIRTGAIYLAFRARMPVGFDDTVQAQLFTFGNDNTTNWWLPGDHFRVVRAPFGQITDDVNFDASLAHPAAGTWFTFEMLWTTDSRSVSLNGGTDISTTTTFTPVDTDYLFVGGLPDSGAGENGDCDIACFILGNTIPGATARTNMRAHLLANAPA